MREAIYKASCLICGKNLFKGAANSYFEGYCPKCGCFLRITFHENGVNSVIGVTDMAENIRQK